MTTFERVRRVFVEDLDITACEVLSNVSLVDVIDSMERALLVLELEDEFGIEIMDDEMKSIFTIGDIVNYVDSHSHEPRLAAHS